MRTIHVWRVLRGLPQVMWRKPCEEQYVRAQFADAPAVCNVLREVTPTRHASNERILERVFVPNPAERPIGYGNLAVLFSRPGKRAYLAKTVLG